MFQRSMPVLMVKDVAATVAYYEKLRFGCLGMFGDPVNFGIVQRGAVTLAFDQTEAALPLNRGWAAYLYVSNVDQLFEDYKDLGLEMSGPPEDKFYGCRDFTIYDLDGHQIAFGQDLDPVHGPGLAKVTG